MPNSRGLLLTRNNEEFLVERIFYTPTGLRYEGKGMLFDPTAALTPLVEHVAEVPGESRIGYYNLITGKIEEAGENIPTEDITNEAQEEGEEEVAQVGEQPVPVEKGKDLPVMELKPRTDAGKKLLLVLTNFFDTSDLDSLYATLGLDPDVLDNGHQVNKALRIVNYGEDCELIPSLILKAYELYHR